MLKLWRRPTTPPPEEELGDGGPAQSLLEQKLLSHLAHIECLARLHPGEIILPQELDEICAVIDRIRTILAGADQTDLR